MNPVIKLVGTRYHASDVRMEVTRVPCVGEFLKRGGHYDTAPEFYRVRAVVHTSRSTGSPNCAEVYVEQVEEAQIG